MSRVTAMFLILACAGATCVGTKLSRYPYYLAKESEGKPPPARWLVTSMNLDFELPQNLVDPSEAVRAALLSYLKGSGCEASSVSLSEARQRLAELLAAASPAAEGAAMGGAEERERALGLLARDLAGNREFDVMLVPNVVTREAYFSYLTVTWDGVSRRHPVSGRIGKIQKGSISGNTEVLSLHVRAWSKSGEKIFESYGGLDILNTIVIEDYQFVMLPRSDLFQDPAELRESVSVSLHPLVPQPPE